jgi:hypothetical protein
MVHVSTLFEYGITTMIRSMHLLLAIAFLLLAAAPAEAADLARYWSGFRSYWGDTFGNVSGVLGIGLLTGFIGILIIVSGKWKR